MKIVISNEGLRVRLSGVHKSLDSILSTDKIDDADAEDGDEEDSKAGKGKHPVFSMECHWVCPPHSRAGPTPRTS